MRGWKDDKMKWGLEVSIRGRATGIPAVLDRLAPRRLVVVPILLATAIGSPGCGSSGQGSPGDGQEKKAPEYRYEGTGRAKTKTRIRPRDVRREKLKEAAKNEPG
jgi:hypothetical protein